VKDSSFLAQELKRMKLKIKGTNGLKLFFIGSDEIIAY
jgi:hypothetical protein